MPTLVWFASSTWWLLAAPQSTWLATATSGMLHVSRFAMRTFFLFFLFSFSPSSALPSNRMPVWCTQRRLDNGLPPSCSVLRKPKTPRYRGDNSLHLARQDNSEIFLPWIQNLYYLRLGISPFSADGIRRRTKRARKRIQRSKIWWSSSLWMSVFVNQSDDDKW